MVADARVRAVVAAAGDPVDAPGFVVGTDILAGDCLTVRIGFVARWEVIEAVGLRKTLRA